MAKFHLECTECSARYEEDPARLTCSCCAPAQAPGEPLRGVLEVVLEELPRAWPPGALDSPGFLEAFLPLDAGALFDFPVGGTPLLAAPRLRERLGMPALWIKDETRNPSGSTKDRASLLVAAKARQYGHRTLAAASTGNAASSLAACCAAAGLEAVILMPAAAPRAKQVQVLVHGARLVPVAGSYDAAYELACVACERHGWYCRSTALNPFTVEGKKTAALEIAAQVPGGGLDVVVVPTGDGAILAGLAKGFRDLQRGGLLERIPRLIAVQPTGSAAIVDAVRSGSDEVLRHEGASSVADSLVVESPRNARWCLRALRASGGAGIAVGDQSIREAILELAALSGVFAEPAGAAALAGLREALAQGIVEPGECVVLLVTGTGLKDLGAVRSAFDLPAPIEPSLEALWERLLEFPGRKMPEL